MASFDELFYVLSENNFMLLDFKKADDGTATLRIDGEVGGTILVVDKLPESHMELRDEVARVIDRLKEGPASQLTLGDEA